MLGEKALELVKECARSQDMLGPYNEDKVSVIRRKSVTDRIDKLAKK